jgi:DNA-binding LacI/PurR family transcriptional regulator
MKKQISRKKVKLADIARKAGCSANTVSLALRNSKRISEDLRKKIHTIAEQFLYTPHYAARNLRVRRSGMIGVYTHILNDAVRTDLVNHFLEELHTTEYRPVLGLGQGSTQGPWHTSPWMQTFRELRVEALVVLWGTVDKLPEWTKSIPIILVGCEPDETLPCDYLALDRIQAGTMGVEHLISRGHREILVGTAMGCNFGKGCVKTLSVHHAKLFEPSCELTAANLPEAQAYGFNLASQNALPSGAIFGDSGIAASFMRGVLDSKRRIPEDIAVVGYDYFPWAPMLAVPLTTVEQPIETMASAAVDLIRNRLTIPDAPPVHIVQPHRLVIRESS